MEWTQLEAVLAVAQHRSFTRAARQLHLTQPGVSRQVQRLERELGVRLFIRRRGAVDLTPAGERVCAFAAATLAGRDQLIGDLRQGAAELVGELRIAASTTPGEFVVPGLVARFAARHPGVLPQIAISDSTEVIESLDQARVDLGFVGARLPARGVRYQAVAEDEVVLAVPAGHRFAARATVALSELEDEPFVEREGGSGTLLSVRRALAKRGLSLPPFRVVMVLGSTQAVVSAVEQGHGLGWVSSLAVAHRRPEYVAAVRLAELPIRRTLYLVTPTRRPLPAVPAAFVDWLRRERPVTKR